MNKLIGIPLTIALLGTIGCTKKSPPAGPGATQTDRSYQAPNDTRTPSDTTDADRTFKLVVPATETDLDQGQQKEVTISINRGKDFKESVKLKFTPPAGVTVTPPEVTISPSEKEAKVMIEAAKDATLGEGRIDVAAIPESGKPTSMQMKVEVTED